MRILGSLAIASSLLLASPAIAQLDTSTPTPTTDPSHGGLIQPPYNPRSVPVIQTPTNRLKNIIGRTAEATCLRNGRAAVICASVGVAAGGVGIARAMDESWTDIGTQVAGGAVVGAAVSAAASCAAGAAIGIWAGGVGAIPGCMAGLGHAALAGGFFGAATGYYNLLADGSIQVDNTGQVAGPGVATSTPMQSPGTATWFDFRPNPEQNLAAAYNRYGAQRTFLCSSYARYDGYLHECMFVMVTTPRPDGDAYGYLRYDEPYSINQFKFCSGYYRANTCGNDERFYWPSPNDGLGVARDPVQVGGGNARQPILIQSAATYGSASAAAAAAANIPSRLFQPIASPTLGASGFSPAIPAAKLSQPLDPNFVAAMTNAAMKAAGPALQQQGLGEAAGDKSTAQDYNSAMQQPGAPTQAVLGDLYRPMADLNAGGGTKDAPISEPTQVINVGAQPSTGTTGSNGGTSTGTTSNPTVTQEKADKDLDNEAGGVLGNPIQPVIDFIMGPLAPFMSPTFTEVQGECPVWTVDMRPWFGWFLNHDIDGKVVASNPVSAKAAEFLQWDSSQVCDFFDSQYSTIQLIMGLLILVRAFVRFFE